MLLAEVASAVGGRVLRGADARIDRVVDDSRQAGPGALFVAIPGHRQDGHQFAAAAARAGAALAVQHPLPIPDSAPVILVGEPRRALGEIASLLAGRPSERLLLAGVTGTDGKTTVTHLAAHLLRGSGVPAGFVSTVSEDRGAGAERNASGLTSTTAPALQQALSEMVERGVRVAVVEASSHALDQDRLWGCAMDVAAYTYVGHDHLDYHRDWEGYLAAKAKLLDLCDSPGKGVPKTAVLNRDDRSYAPLRRHRELARTFDYTLRPGILSALRATGLQADGGGTRFDLHLGDRAAATRMPVPGRFNVANALCATGICLAAGLRLEAVAGGLASFPGVPGRLEAIDRGQPFQVFVDYAHAAESLASALTELRQVAGGRVLCVFGCSDRSDGHDPQGMGRAAALGSDWFCITTDDPVDTDPAELAARVEAGARSAGRGVWEVELDRQRAIDRAIGIARSGDVVLLAGKGHEQFMMREGRRKDPWNEREAAETALARAGWSGPPQR
ncbi:MAG: Mur ligase family protein [Candidatus Dormibacteraceae bacterium]